MAGTKFSARQVISRDVLNQIVNETGKELDDILRAINSEVTSPLSLTESTIPDLILNIGNIIVTNPNTNKNKTIPAIGDLNDTLPIFASGTVTMSGANPLFTATPSIGAAVVFTINPGNYIKMVISLLDTGDLKLSFGVQGVTPELATFPSSVDPFQMGYIILENIGGTLQNIENTDIFQYIGGGAGGNVRNLNDLLDVNTIGVSDQDVLTWESASSKWVAQAGGGSGNFDTILTTEDGHVVVDDAGNLVIE